MKKHKNQYLVILIQDMITGICRGQAPVFSGIKGPYKCSHRYKGQ